MVRDVLVVKQARGKRRRCFPREKHPRKRLQGSEREEQGASDAFPFFVAGRDFAAHGVP